MPEESEELPKNKSKPVKEMPVPEEKKASFVNKIKGIVEERHHKKDVGERLRVEESKQSKTRCVVIVVTIAVSIAVLVAVMFHRGYFNSHAA